MHFLDARGGIGRHHQQVIDERAEVASYLAGRPDPKERPAAVRELAWALLASTEFRFNH